MLCTAVKFICSSINHMAEQFDYFNYCLIDECMCVCLFQSHGIHETMNYVLPEQNSRFR